jgi:ribosome-binding factor A
MSRRTERLGSLLQQELAAIIQRELLDPRITGFPSITRVEVAEDLSVADVFVSIMGSPGQQSAALNALKHSAGMMRSTLTKILSLRQVPLIKFHIDEQLRRELEVLRLIGQVNAEKEEMEARAAKLAEAERVRAEAEEARAVAARARHALPHGEAHGETHGETHGEPQDEAPPEAVAPPVPPKPSEQKP